MKSETPKLTMYSEVIHDHCGGCLEILEPVERLREPNGWTGDALPSAWCPKCGKRGRVPIVFGIETEYEDGTKSPFRWIGNFEDDEDYEEPGAVLGAVRKTNDYLKLVRERAADTVTREQFGRAVDVLCTAFKKEKGISRDGW